MTLNIFLFYTDDASLKIQEMDERLVNMYKQIRDILAKYRSGKLPKAFKIIPALANWEQVGFIKLVNTWGVVACKSCPCMQMSQI
jgi:essential nuclear protein 1